MIQLAPTSLTFPETLVIEIGQPPVPTRARTIVRTGATLHRHVRKIEEYVPVNVACDHVGIERVGEAQLNCTAHLADEHAATIESLDGGSHIPANVTQFKVPDGSANYDVTADAA